MTTDFELPFQPLAAGAVCIGLAVLTLICGRRMPGFRRLFLMIVLVEIGAVLLWVGSLPEPQVPPKEMAGAGRNLFFGNGVVEKDTGAANPAPRAGQGGTEESGDDGIKPSGIPGPSADRRPLDPLTPTGSANSGGAGAGFSRPPDVRGGGENLFPAQLDYHKAVFVLDLSGSMASPAGASRYDRLVRDLEERLGTLPDDTAFAIIQFNSAARFLPGDDRLRWLTKSTSTVADVIQRLRSVKPGGGTAPFAALDHALVLRPRTVILLTDGDFDDQDSAGKKKSDLVAEIRTRASKQYTRIYGIFISEAGSGDAERGERDLKSVITNPKNFFRATP